MPEVTATGRAGERAPARSYAPPVTSCYELLCYGFRTALCRVDGVLAGVTGARVVPLSLGDADPAAGEADP